MSKQVAVYARVSSEKQDNEESVSIEEQLADIDKLIERNNWDVLGIFIDNKNYIKTKPPNKGKTVPPKGEYDDRPAFVEMLKKIKTGNIDAIICWRDDRLVRHPRVAVTLEDSLDEADKQRNNDNIQIVDATGAQLDRFTLGIKAQVWREENKRRAERVRLGKVGTLKAGRWPGAYDQYGYDTISEAGLRGRRIIINETEAKIVRLIYELSVQGYTSPKIRKRLIAIDAPQKQESIPRKTVGHLWSPSIITRILRCSDYVGELTWNFRATGESYTIEIPQIIEPKLWRLVQDKIDERKDKSPRNTKGIYLLQYMAYCECGKRLTASTHNYTYRKVANGKYKRYERKNPTHFYNCTSSLIHNDEPHGQKTWRGPHLDYDVWKYLVDNVIEHPEIVFGQITAKQAKLQRQGNDLDGDIAKAQRKLVSIDDERTFLIRQAKKEIISEAEFEESMAETREVRKYWDNELENLKALRDKGIKIQDEIEHATSVLTAIRTKLPKINQTPDEFNLLPDEKKRYVLEERKRIVNALCQRVTIFNDGRIVIDGLIDSDKVSSFDILPSRTAY